ncbi:metal-dependent hydrolase [Fulvivirgaceae bacterium BMA10]|uniref:Metal-dependent hydrolase n=1 Tax=Splendidivirga corallicola TaxID=3051826 RepID=A0ABT8KW88_9BACT|nr:metal-dependent hydrolase [Fulvivirgaceae bacterium BMA10]
MASIFAHGLVAGTIGKMAMLNESPWKLYTLLIICSILPDADVIMFTFGFSYDHFLGHRGFTHSLLFAAILALILTFVFFNISRNKFTIWLVLFLATASHGLLDALTNGGLGVAFFAPFDNARYFLPWRPIQVSPIGAENFFSEWGLRVLKNELIWIGIPCLSLLLFSRLLSKNKQLK